MKTFWDEVRRDHTIKCAQVNYALGMTKDKIIEFLMGMLRVDEKEASHIFETEVKKLYDHSREEGGVNMCKAMENKEKRDKVTGAIEAYRLDGMSDEDIITKIVNHFGVTKEYVLALLNPQKASKVNEARAKLTDCVINVVFDHESGVWVASNDALPITLEDASLDRLVNRLKVAAPEIAESNHVRIPAKISGIKLLVEIMTKD